MELDGRYVLGEVLGRGAFATVYRVKDKQLSVDRAAKVLAPARDARDEDVKRRLVKEARALQRLDHPAIVKVFDSGEHDGATWVVMEVVEGGTVADRLEYEGVFSPEQATRIGLELLAALQVAHESGIIHRDIKPSNVLLTRDGQPKLVDFGIARIVDDETSHKTRTGMAMGSLAFMAPEQKADARSVGPPADLYGLATTLYFMLTGESPLDLFTADLEHDRWRGVPRALREVLWKASRYEAGQRYATAAEMVQALNPDAGGGSAGAPQLGFSGGRPGGGFGGLQTRPEPPKPPPTRRFANLDTTPRREHRPILTGLAVLAFLGVVGGGTWLYATRDHVAPPPPPVEPAEPATRGTTSEQPASSAELTLETIAQEAKQDPVVVLDHRWEGRCGDHWVRVELSGDADVVGTAGFSGYRRRVEGEYDEAARSIVLREQDCAPCGTFAGRVSPDLGELTGSYDSKGGLDCTFSGKLR